MVQIPDREVEVKVKVDASELQGILDNIREGFEDLDKKIQKRRKSITIQAYGQATIATALLLHLADHYVF